MNDDSKRRYEMLVRVKQFGTDNSADFSANPIAVTRFDEVADFVNGIVENIGGQQAGFAEAAQQTEVKGTIRENLREQMATIARTANSMEYEFDGISDLFRFKRNLNDANLLARGRAMHTESLAYNADFIAYGMPSGFRASLVSACDAFEASFGEVASAKAAHVEATALTNHNVRQAMVAVRVLDGIVKNTYASNPGKLAAWVSASHVEKAPTPPPPPET
jgi:hypothetical protein